VLFVAFLTASRVVLVCSCVRYVHCLVYRSRFLWWCVQLVVFVDLNEQDGCTWDGVPLSATELVTVAVARAQYGEDWAHGPLAYAAALSASYELGDRFALWFMERVLMLLVRRRSPVYCLSAMSWLV
jgi:hypothetical protein